MQRLAWIIGLCGLPGMAGASELYRCETTAGAVSYQDVPCGAGSRLTKTIALPDVAPATAREAKSKEKKAKPAKPKPAASGTRAKTSAGRARQRQACADAKAERARILDGLGLERTFEHLRALDDKVAAVCKGL